MKCKKISYSKQLKPAPMLIYSSAKVFSTNGWSYSTGRRKKFEKKRKLLQKFSFGALFGLHVSIDQIVELADL